MSHVLKIYTACYRQRLGAARPGQKQKNKKKDNKTKPSLSVLELYDSLAHLTASTPPYVSETRLWQSEPMAFNKTSSLAIREEPGQRPRTLSPLESCGGKAALRPHWRTCSAISAASALADSMAAGRRCWAETEAPQLEQEKFLAEKSC